VAAAGAVAGSPEQMKESPLTVMRRAVVALRRRGIVYAYCMARNRIYLGLRLHALSARRQRYFMFRGQRLQYLQLRKGDTWTGERGVEIPIIWAFLGEYPHERLLEIGNATHHYRDLHADVYEKYEIAEGVKNIDVVDIAPDSKYDMAISVSTLEHVGWDEEEKDPRKILAAIENIKDNCLKEGGVFVFTVPIGQNPYLDKLLRDNEIEMNQEFYLKRISLSNRWVQTTKADALTKEYSFPYECANAILVGVVKN
jgi:hypothetical protein